MADFLMPALGADMETGKVVQWLVTPGSRVKPGDVVAVVETHKGAIDVEIFLDGVIDEMVPVGAQLPVGAVLAHVRSQGEVAVQSPAAKTVPAPAPAPIPTPIATAAPALAVTSPGRVRASPAARRRAGELGVQLELLHGSGVDGAVTLGDVEAAAAAKAASPSAQPVRRAGFDLAQMRQAIAAAMSRSKREIPHYYLSRSIDFGEAARWVDTYNRDRGPEDRLLPAALLLAASAVALARVPQFNGFYIDGSFRAGAGVHLGWAIALRGGGLVAPAIHDADRKTPAQLMAALRDLVQRARAGGLRSSEMTDATATVTSLGDRGADSVLGVIYPPQVAMIGFGRVLERPWAVDGRVEPRLVVQTSLAADHRASDGHSGGLLLAAIDAALQSPDALWTRSTS
ncbi:MAG TPA: dihydrolipoamide acetyltransferase family protein [Albitalea sp.]|nr:dihydrolipoamide acetyltransferase family protein [Albitalea sp.]